MGLIDLTDIQSGPPPKRPRRTPEQKASRKQVKVWSDQLAACPVHVDRGVVAVPALTLRDGGQVVFHDDDVAFTIAARRKVLDALEGVDPFVIDAVAVASFMWWKRRLRPAWKRANSGRQWLPQTTRSRLARYVLEHSRRGSSGCKQTWTCCNYCAHGRAMLRAVEFLTEHQSPIHLNVTLVPILPAHENRSRHRVNLDPADKPPVTIKRARHALSAFTATNPHYGLDAALLVPSIRSSSKDLDGRLHIHALLAVSGFVPLVHLAAVAEVFGLHVNWLADRHEVQRTPLDYGRVLSYNLEQVMTDPTDFGRKPRVQTWKPTAKLHRYATSRKLHAALSDANRRGAAAARAEASKRFARGR